MSLEGSRTASEAREDERIRGEGEVVKSSMAREQADDATRNERADSEAAQRTLDARSERVGKMSEMLDAHVAKRSAALVGEARERLGSDPNAVGVIEAIRSRIENARAFFLSIDAGKRAEMPLERMAALYEYLKAPEAGDDRVQFDAGLTAHMKEMVERAFDQHLDNPEQYVSHGFDHSLNVADYTKDIIALNDPIVDATAQKYGISSNEAKFMLENLALFHDCGYPHVGARAKAVHGIAGADLISTPEMQGMFKQLIRTPGAKLDLLNHDLRDAVLFHSADKVEHRFSAKIRTTRGTFLAEGKDVYEVISTFNDPLANPTNVPRELIAIETFDEATKTEIEAALLSAASDTQTKTGRQPAPVTVTVVGERFKGRFTDLQKAKDNRLGLEYSEVDAEQEPLHAVIRLADNMDMRRNRFSPLQREPAFRALYEAFGDGAAPSRALAALEMESRTFNKAMASAATDEQKGTLLSSVIANVRERLGALAAENQDAVAISQEAISSLQHPEDAVQLWKRSITENILRDSKYKGLPDETRVRMLEVALAQDTQAMRHFGGCESVLNVRMERLGESGAESSIVVVTVNGTQFRSLNEIRVTDSSIDEEGNVSSVEVGAGEYQVWRAKEAYRSISVGGRKIGIRVQDEEGREVQSSFSEFREEK